MIQTGQPLACHPVVTLAAVAATAMIVAGGRGAQPQLFSEGEAYERFMGRWSRALAPLLVRFAGVTDGETLLDVGSGTGALSAAIAAAAPSGQVVGLDPAEAYVSLARARHPSDRIAFHVGDAQQMPFDDGRFDRTLSLLVLNFVPDPMRAVNEMHRVTKRGGTVAGAVWDYGDGMQMLRIFWDEAVALSPASAASDERHMPLSRAGELGAAWRRAGLEQVVEEGLTVETRFTSFDDYWVPFLDRQGPAGAYVNRLSAAERTLLKARLQKRLLGGGPDRPIVLTARAWAVRGTVPG